MKRLLLILGLLLGSIVAAQAQVPCVGVGGVNNVSNNSIVCGQEPSVLTAGAVGYGIVPAASATDVACITGAANTVVRVQRIRVAGTAGTAVVLPIALEYRTSADSGGTAGTSTAAPVPFAINGGSGSTPKATTISYTANPTVNDATNRPIAVQNLVLTTTSTLTGVQNDTLFDWSGQRYMQAPTLNSTAQQVCVNFLGISVSSGLVAVEFEWTEAAQ